MATYIWLIRRKKRKIMYIKKQGLESNHKKYKAIKSIKTQAIKKHNNQDTINTQIK
jgi:hypothetical protein